jgi:dipeptidyl aminopeptidase/acylaminoacyl peptidase
MLRRLLIFVAALALIALVGGVIALSASAYHLFSQVQPGCPGHENATPADYDMPTYEDVRLPSRDRGLAISGFWIPADAVTDGATVLVLHGNAACKRSPESLIPAEMLHRAGFNVLAIDMRDVGDSEIEDGRSAAGSEEYLDLLGAWDWVQTAHDVPPEQIGVFGYSLGGSTALIAMGEEPKIAAVWADSAFADINDVLDYATRDVPAFGTLKPLALLMGRLMTGDDITRMKPVDEVRRIGERPLYLVHGMADNVVPFAEIGKLADAVRDAGGSVQTWATASGHVGSMADTPAEYEARLVAFFEGALRQLSQ